MSGGAWRKRRGSDRRRQSGARHGAGRDPVGTSIPASSKGRRDGTAFGRARRHVHRSDRRDAGQHEQAPAGLLRELDEEGENNRTHPESEGFFARVKEFFEDLARAAPRARSRLRQAPKVVGRPAIDRRRQLLVRLPHPEPPRPIRRPKHAEMPGIAADRTQRCSGGGPGRTRTHRTTSRRDPRNPPAIARPRTQIAETQYRRITQPALASQCQRADCCSPAERRSGPGELPYTAAGRRCSCWRRAARSACGGPAVAPSAHAASSVVRTSAGLDRGARSCGRTNL